MLTTKIILAFLLSLFPVLFLGYIKPKRKQVKWCSNLYTFVMASLPFLGKIKRAMAMFLLSVSIGMKKSHTFRKFFSLLFIIIALIYQFTDFCASSDVAQIVLSAVAKDGHQSIQETAVFSVYLPYMSEPLASILTMGFTMPFFKYKWADRIFSFLHESNYSFIVIGFIAIIISIYNIRCFICTEILVLLLYASSMYPKMIVNTESEGSTRLLAQRDNQEYIE